MKNLSAVTCALNMVVWLFSSQSTPTYHHMETAFQLLKKTGSWAHPWGSNLGSLGGTSQLY